METREYHVVCRDSLICSPWSLMPHTLIWWGSWLVCLLSLLFFLSFSFLLIGNGMKVRYMSPLVVQLNSRGGGNIDQCVLATFWAVRQKVRDWCLGAISSVFSRYTEVLWKKKKVSLSPVSREIHNALIVSSRVWNSGTKSNSVASLSDFHVKIKDQYNKFG